MNDLSKHNLVLDAPARGKAFPVQDLPMTVRDRKIAVVGLGYVGLPVAVSFAQHGFSVVGFDVNRDRVAELRRGKDRTHEVAVERLKETPVRYIDDSAALAAADFFIVTVPTPIDSAFRPDLSALLRASETVGRNLKKGDIVVYESTVYPGATEEECIPILERESGLTAGRDFAVGYSPERINPGDVEHRFETITKVVSAQTPEALEIVAAVYGSVVEAGIYRAPSIKVAEAAKVIENTQRDINIAFMNELATIFQRLGIDTHDVLKAAGTKWNFLPFSPGLVGGHCIGVDPFYLTYRAAKAGHHPEVILAGRRINDSFGEYIGFECIRNLLRHRLDHGITTILGLTFKENVPDIRNTRVIDIIRVLKSFGQRVQIHDPLASPKEAEEEYGITLTPLEQLEPAHAVIFAVPHQVYLQQGWPLVQRCLVDGGLVLDIKAKLDRSQVPAGTKLWRP